MKINIEQNKNEFIGILSKVEREGIAALLYWLESSDFFTAPASAKHHLAVPGGLCFHSLNVYYLLQEKVERYLKNELGLLDIRTIAAVKVCALCHDICKVNFYEVGADYPASEPQRYTLGREYFNLRSRGYFSEEDKKRFEEYCFENGGPVKKTISSAVASKLIDWLKNSPKEPMPETPVTYKFNDQFPFGHGEKSVSILQDFIKMTEEEKLSIRFHMSNWDLSDYSKPAYNQAVQKYPLVTLVQTADIEASNILEKE